MASGGALQFDRREFFEHIPALDGLRGIAILLVLVHNAAHFGAHPPGIVWIAALVGAIGWTGVQLFFVLSGFLITSKLLATQRAPNYYSVFFGRRVLRIFPLYYAALIVGLIIVPALTQHAAGEQSPGFHQIWLWTFLFNWAHPLGTPAYGFPHFWSLAVEEQFYLVWPFVVHKLAPKTLGRACLAIIAGAFIVRTIMALVGASDEMIYEFTICRMDALAMGALIAAWLHQPDRVQQLQSRAAWFLPTAFAILIVGAAFSRLYTRDVLFTQTIGYTFLATFFALLLLASVMGTRSINRFWQRLLSVHALRSIGKYSFAMYVFHFPIQLYFEKSLPWFEQRFGTWSGMMFVLVVGLISYVAAFISYHVYEKRFLKLKSWFTPRSQALPSQDVQTLEHA